MKKHTVWDEQDVDRFAKELVKLRCEYPFGQITAQLLQAQEAIFDVNNRRNLTSFAQVKHLSERFTVHWKLAMKAEPLPPQIIQIPVEKEPDFISIMNRTELPTRIALLVESLAQLVGNGHTLNGGATARHDTPISLQRALTKPALEEKNQPLRVAICTPDGRMFADAMAAIKDFTVPMQLRHVDLDTRSPSIPTTVDYVIFPHLSHASPAWKAARETWPAKNVIQIGPHTGTLTEALIQKLRDLTTRQKPVAK